MGAVLLPAGLLLIRSHPAREGGGKRLQRSPRGGGGGVGVEPGLQDGLNLRRDKILSLKAAAEYCVVICQSVGHMTTQTIIIIIISHLLFLLPVVQGGRGILGSGRGIVGHRDSVLVPPILLEQPQAQSVSPTVLVTDAVGVGGANLVGPAGLLHRHHLLQPRLQSCRGGRAGRRGEAGGGRGLQALELAQVLDLHSLGSLAAGGAVGGGAARLHQPIAGRPVVLERLQHPPPPLSIRHGLHGSSGRSDEPVAQLLLLLRRDGEV